MSTSHAAFSLLVALAALSPIVSCGSSASSDGPTDGDGGDRPESGDGVDVGSDPTNPEAGLGDAAGADAANGDGAIEVGGAGPPGGLDGSFGSGGVVTPIFKDPTGASLPLGEISDLIRDRAGRLVAVARAAPAGGKYISIVARFDAKGALDGTFASGTGYRTFATTGALYALSHVRQEPSGDYVLVGGRDVDYALGTSAITMLRLREDGSDAAPAAGTVKVDPGPFFDDAVDIALDGAGNVVIAAEGARSVKSGDCREQSVGSNCRYPQALRLRPNGTPDATFGKSPAAPGTSTGAFAPINTACLGQGSALALERDRPVILAREYTIRTPYQPGLVLAYLTNGGELDASINPPGARMPGCARIALPSSVTVGGIGAKMVALPGGGLIVAFTGSNGGSADFFVTRIDAKGAVDTTFGKDGFARVDIDGRLDMVSAVAVQADGRIVVAGQTYTYGRSPVDYRFSVARLTAAGALDASFGAGGKILFDKLNGRVNAIALEGRTHILLAGGDASTGGVTVARLFQ